MKTVPKIYKSLYIRFGEIPLNERSGIYKNTGEVKVGEELGGSCYRGVVIDDKVYIIMPHNPSSTYYWLIDAYNRKEIPLYIINGDEVGEGSDGEPLLRNVVVLIEVYDWKA